MASAISRLCSMKMHFETLSSTHIGRAMSGAAKALKRMPGDEAAAAKRQADACLQAWKEIARSGQRKLKARRVREALADAADFVPGVTPFQRMERVRELRRAGVPAVQSKFGAGFDSDKHLHGAATTAGPLPRRQASKPRSSLRQTLLQTRASQSDSAAAFAAHSARRASVAASAAGGSSSSEAELSLSDLSS